MIRPSRFYPNPETAADNAFQSRGDFSVDALSVAARNEFDSAVQTLRDAGVKVHVFEDTVEPEKPDAVFPNNWISTSHDGRVALFPMYSELRRRERRHDIIEGLRKSYKITEVIDYSGFEKQGRCLEGTGSLVLDHLKNVGYVSLSNRSNLKVIRRFADDFCYEAVTFTSTDSVGRPIYHTNVMMCFGTDFALVGLDLIPNEAERRKVRELLGASGRQIIELTPGQVANFAGNAIELRDGSDQKLLVLSTRALSILQPDQLTILTSFVRLVPVTIPTIELGGGSARCMIATIHLPAL